VKLDENPHHVPIGLLRKTVLKRAIEPGQLITFDDVDILPSRALDIVMRQRAERIARSKQTSGASREPGGIVATGS